MSKRRTDLTGQVFGQWTVLEMDYSEVKSRVIVRCSCGLKKTMLAERLTCKKRPSTCCRRCYSTAAVKKFRATLEKKKRPTDWMRITKHVSEMSFDCKNPTDPPSMCYQIYCVRQSVKYQNKFDEYIAEQDSSRRCELLTELKAMRQA